eukprot:EG_transcript_26118
MEPERISFYFWGVVFFQTSAKATGDASSAREGHKVAFGVEPGSQGGYSDKSGTLEGVPWLLCGFHLRMSADNQHLLTLDRQQRCGVTAVLRVHFAERNNQFPNLP